ncbi:MAG: hypothetical protein ACE5K1_02440 [Acidiferrobacterales bacterium]
MPKSLRQTGVALILTLGIGLLRLIDAALPVAAAEVPAAEAPADAGQGGKSSSLRKDLSSEQIRDLISRLSDDEVGHRSAVHGATRGIHANPEGVRRRGDSFRAQAGYCRSCQHHCRGRAAGGEKSPLIGVGRAVG